MRPNRSLLPPLAVCGWVLRHIWILPLFSVITVSAQAAPTISFWDPHTAGEGCIAVRSIADNSYQANFFQALAQELNIQATRLTQREQTKCNVKRVQIAFASEHRIYPTVTLHVQVYRDTQWVTQNQWVFRLEPSGWVPPVVANALASHLVVLMTSHEDPNAEARRRIFLDSVTETDLEWIDFRIPPQAEVSALGLDLELMRRTYFQDRTPVIVVLGDSETLLSASAWQDLNAYDVFVVTGQLNDLARGADLVVFPNQSIIARHLVAGALTLLTQPQRPLGRQNPHNDGDRYVDRTDSLPLQRFALAVHERNALSLSLPDRLVRGSIIALNRR